MGDPLQEVHLVQLKETSTPGVLSETLAAHVEAVGVSRSDRLAGAGAAREPWLHVLQWLPVTHLSFSDARRQEAKYTFLK